MMADRRARARHSTRAGGARSVHSGTVSWEHADGEDAGAEGSEDAEEDSPLAAPTSAPWSDFALSPDSSSPWPDVALPDELEAKLIRAPERA